MKKKIIIISVIAVVAIALIVTAALLLNNGKKFTITFETDGGNTIEAIQLKKNATLILPEKPVKEGFVFLNWVDEDGNPILNNFTVTKDKILTAKWAEADKELVTITFDTDGGSKIDAMTIEKGSTITLPKNPTKNGYDFKKWLNEAGQDFNAQNPIEDNITLKAQWEKQEEKQEEKKEENKEPENKTVEVDNITLNTTSLDMIVGNTSTLTAAILPDNATDKNITWTSSNTSVATVDASGNVTAKTIGSAIITATTSNGRTASATVFSDVESISLSVSNSNISKYGTTQSTTLTVTTTPDVDIMPSMIVWSAPDATGANAAASFSSSGKTATITARDAYGSSLSSIPTPR